jgi:hypothetical protein
MRASAHSDFCPPESWEIRCCSSCFELKDTAMETPVYSATLLPFFACVSSSLSLPLSSSPAPRPRTSASDRLLMMSRPWPMGTSCWKTSWNARATCRKVRAIASSLRWSRTSMRFSIDFREVSSSARRSVRVLRWRVQLSYCSKAFLLTCANCLCADVALASSLAILRRVSCMSISKMMAAYLCLIPS